MSLFSFDRPWLFSIGSDDQEADGLALFFSFLGGFFMGAYPVPIKAPSVLKADPHPVIFQCYKTFWVFATGWLFILANVIQGKELIFEFTWWGVVSAAGWIPSGLGTIAAVPRIGVSMGIAINTSTASMLTFLVFWLILKEKMKTHDWDGHKIYLAPIYFVCILAGVTGMVLANGQSSSRGSSGAGDDARSLSGVANAERATPLQDVVEETSGEDVERSGEQHRHPHQASGRLTAALGFFFAIIAGLFSAVQYGAINLGKKAAERADGCADDTEKCSPVFKEQFNNAGSWMASFGIGTVLVTSVYVAGFFAIARLNKQDLPEFHFQVLRVPGTIAGLLWVLGNFFQTAAVVRGGNAVMLPANQAIQLVTSGAFGLLYYKEMPNLCRASLWSLAAMWTLVAVIFLSQEKA